MTANLNPQAAKVELWRRGNLSFKMDATQKDIVNKIKKSNEKIFVVLSSRQLGKTYLACLLAVETCLKTPNANVKYLAPSKTMVESIVTSIFQQIFEDCPDQLRPSNVKSKYTYTFPNGSRIQLAGSDGGHSEKLRGHKADLCIVDEAGFCRDLTNTVRSILIPTTLHTNGKIILITTPPKEMDHDFIRDFLEEAETNGAFIKKTIYDNVRLTQEQIDNIVKSYQGGVNNNEFKREFLCELLKSTLDGSAIPEFDDSLEKKIVKPWKRPAFFDSYVAMDIGGKDLTAVLFGYYDFINSKVVVEDELIMDFREQSNTVKKLSDLIIQKEEDCFFEKMTGEVKQPYLRVSDINYIVMDEIRKASSNRLIFVPTKKDDKEAAVNNLRVMLNSEQIVINPKCTTLIRHLKNVKWAKGKSIFARSPDNGHYDACDALIYLTRAVIRNKNPYPSYYNMNTKDLFVLREQNKVDSHTISVFKKAFRVKEK